MSILIKGMKMPTNDEILCIDIYPDGKVCINLDLNCNQVATAVPVPPHGDLIERKAVGLTDFEIVMCNGDYKEGLKMLLEKIESALTIISEDEDGCDRCDHCRINETGTCRYAEEDE